MSGNGVDERADALQPTPEVLGRLLRGELDEDERARLPNREPEPTGTSAPPGDEPGDEPAAPPDAAAEPPAEPPETESEPDDAPSTGESDGEGEAPPGLSVRDLADKAGMSAAELYDELRVPMPDGRGDVTLDELKGVYIEHAAFEDERATFEDERDDYNARRTEHELHNIRLNREIQSVMRFVQTLPPELVQAGQQAFEQELADERELLFGAAPELANPQEFERQRQVNWETARAYGFSRAEVDSINDHRLVLMLRDYARLQEREKAAREALREARDRARQTSPKASNRRTSASGKPNRVTREATRRGATNETKARAVSAILNRGR